MELTMVNYEVFHLSLLFSMSIASFCNLVVS